MKVVDRKEFLAMPAGTLYTKFEPCVFVEESIMEKSIAEQLYALLRGARLTFEELLSILQILQICSDEEDWNKVKEVLARTCITAEKCVPECAYREKVTELQAKLNLTKDIRNKIRKQQFEITCLKFELKLAKAIYPEKMKLVGDALLSIGELADMKTAQERTRLIFVEEIKA